MIWINHDKTEAIRLESIDSWVYDTTNDCYSAVLSMNIHGMEVILTDDDAEDVYKILLMMMDGNS
jgi:hypothetical protein